MRRTIMAAFAAALLAIAPSAAQAAPNQDQVTGYGTIAGSSTIEANVRSDVDGSNPRGIFGWVNTATDGLSFRGQPTCMVVDGNTAIIGGYQKDHPSGYKQFFVYIEDGGESGDRSLTAVSVSDGKPNRQQCLDIRAELTVIPEYLLPVEGDFTVVDR